ncbi:MAG: transcription-repair coupling factor [Peptostreptococcaceae bacterium]|nr:transcription-repair coupling factor [Peptostreptococcaceae bacterium]
MLNKGITNISGISEGRVAKIAGELINENRSQCIIITASYLKAKRLASDLSFFVDKPIFVLPAEDEIFVKYEAKSHHELLERLKVLKELRTGKDCIVVAPVSAAIKKMPPHTSFERNSLKIAMGNQLDVNEIKVKLSKMGYERAGLVEARGEFSIRGGIIDIFTPDADNPYRVELFDTDIDSIRSFDIDTQRSIENLKYVEIFPSENLLNEDDLFQKAIENINEVYGKEIKKAEKKGEEQRRLQLIKRRDQLVEFAENTTNLQLLENYLHYFYDELEYLWDYMNKDGILLIDDPDRIYETIENRTKEIHDDFKLLLERGNAVPKDAEIFSGHDDFLKALNKPVIYLFTPFQKIVKGIERVDFLRNVQSKQGPVFNGRIDLLETELKTYVKHGYQVVIACSTEERVTNLKEFLNRTELDQVVKLIKGNLTAGMEFPTDKLCYIADGDIFVTQKYKKKQSKKNDSKSKTIQSFSDLRSGDFVVHENHGIGKFTGIHQLTVQGIKKDYLKIKYAGEDSLYVPVEQMDLIQKYMGADGVPPKIYKLSGGDWKVTKAKAKAAIANMAKELLELSAARKLEKGHSFSEDTIWQREFEDSFPYEETGDQLRSIEEIKSDMEKDIVMERLLCGDVGYGKTEVAARALFKCVADGKQAAILVPTTILANQHYYTLKERFERFPFTVEMLSRFRSETQQKEIIKKIEKGSVDLIIGTHRLLSKDVKFKDLGLLVIDEEQRFGVQHKEKIKELRKNVDVLSMSATPIPRTLHMSLVGIRDMSLIEEPPEERYPVQTYVLEQEEDLIREAVERELDRGGQVFVVFNRVRGIHKIAGMIAKLVPEARVAIGHGQMNEGELEDVMISFINNETNVLIATTIIESGIDIPNANTIIILDADKMGLSQLYQLRGRVGRSNRMAYAYLMHQKDKILSEVAEKRLRAIKEFTEFGAGFKIAMKDLEIRGAGNLLGTEQHGHMVMIGYELYCKLIDDAIRALGGEIVNPDKEETTVELISTAFIPDWYISDEILKLQMYKKIASVASEQDEDEIIDELMDRFGDAPIETLNLIKISRIRSLSEKLCITRVHEEISKVIFNFAASNPLKAEMLGRLVGEYGQRIFIHGGVKPFIRYSLKGKDKLDEVVKLLENML